MIFLARLRWTGWAILLIASTGAWAAQGTVLIVSSEAQGAYQQAAEAVQAELIRSPEPVQFVHVPVARLPALREPPPRLYVALGTQACARLAGLAAPTPVLCTLLPQAAFERVLRDSGRRPGPTLSALYLNQPLSRQLALLRLALPQARSVGVLWGAESQRNAPALRAAARGMGWRLVEASVGPGEPIFRSLQPILAQADVLLALADPQIYNSNTIQNILLASFRADVPMLAFSPSYVHAGALMAVYSTPVQIGRQAGSLARQVLGGQALAAPQYPAQFEVAVNERVARSLGLQLDGAELTRRLRQQEPGT